MISEWGPIAFCVLTFSMLTTASISAFQNDVSKSEFPFLFSLRSSHRILVTILAIGILLPDLELLTQVHTLGDRKCKARYDLKLIDFLNFLLMI